MTNRQMGRLTDCLEEYLAQEKEALLAGDLEKLAMLATEKEKLIVDFANQSNLSSELIVDLSARIQANHALFEGALEGVRSVARKLGAVRRARNDLQTYTEDGRKENLPSSGVGRLEKRA